MSTVNYPSIAYVRQCLEYRDGRLFWLQRPREHFKKDWSWRVTNNRYAGKEAGKLSVGNYRSPRVMVKMGNGFILRYIIVWALHHDEWRIGLDHINRNQRDDRIENLRPATPSQNNANGPKQRNNKSGYKGVSWSKVGKKWQAFICVNNKNYGLGYFDDPAEAHAAYMAAATKQWGEFAHPGD